MRNGISPLYKLVRGGVRVAIGIDDKPLNDDDDILFELRLASALSRFADFDFAGTPALAPHEIFALGTVNAARSLGFQGQIGTLAAGMRADLVLLDGRTLQDDPWIIPTVSPATLVLGRASRHHVTDVVVNGSIVMRERKLLSVDVDALYREIGEVMRSRSAAPQGELRTKIEAIRPYYQRWYAELLAGSGVLEAGGASMPPHPSR